MKVKIKYVTSQSLKILLCLVILFTFMYSQPRNQVEQASAALPILAWVAPVLGSILVDTAVDMGVEFVDESAKNKWKDKKVTELWNKYGEKIKDLKPTKKNLTKWLFEAPKWLMVAIVDAVTDSMKEVKKDDDDRREKNEAISYSSIDLDSDDPFYNTGVTVLGVNKVDDDLNDRRFVSYMNEWVNYSFQPVSFGQRVKFSVSSEKDFSDDSTNSLYVAGGSEFYLTVGLDNSDEMGYLGLTDGDKNLLKITYSNSTSETLMNGQLWYGKYGFMKSYRAFVKYLELLEQQNKKVYYADGVLSTDGHESYLDLPDTDDSGTPIVYSPDVLEKIDDEKYPMIKEKEFEFDFGDDTGVIDAEFEVINEGDNVDWEIIEKDITNNINNYDKTLNYDYEPTINNYYEIAEKDDLKNDINVIIQNEIDVDNGDGNWSGEITIDGPFYCVDKTTRLPTACKTVEAIDGSLLDYVSNAYDYAVNAVKSGVDGVATITAGATGLIALYSHIFSWLPSEVTVILTSGLLLMIGLRVFRK